MRLARFLIFALVCCAAFGQTQPAPDSAAITKAFNREVTLQLTVPPEEQLAYAALLASELVPLNLEAPEYAIVVDRNPFVQAIFLYFFDPDASPALRFIGASPVSTGKPGRVDYFTTPAGIFEHTVDNPDFRAEGTFNEHGIRGYGLKGMRVYDFGWRQAVRGWGKRYSSTIRLQMHATDPDQLQPRLGSAQSKGCIRIHASLNTFFDRHGILDAAYQQGLDEGRDLWVLRPDREPTPYPGRWLVIVDTARTARPAWSPLPKNH